MNKELKKAFKETIERWEKIIDDVTYYARSGCALCDYKVNNLESGLRCKGCPVREKTGKSQCGGTPWGRFMRNRTTENALRELVFLKNLYIELVECPIPSSPLEDALRGLNDKIEEEKRAKKGRWVDITKECKYRADGLGRGYYVACTYGNFMLYQFKHDEMKWVGGHGLDIMTETEPDGTFRIFIKKEI